MNLLILFIVIIIYVSLVFGEIKNRNCEYQKKWDKKRKELNALTFRVRYIPHINYNDMKHPIAKIFDKMIVNVIVLTNKYNASCIRQKSVYKKHLNNLYFIFKVNEIILEKINSIPMIDETIQCVINRISKIQKYLTLFVNEGILIMSQINDKNSFCGDDFILKEIELKCDENFNIEDYIRSYTNIEISKTRTIDEIYFIKSHEVCSYMTNKCAILLLEEALILREKYMTFNTEHLVFLMHNKLAAFNNEIFKFFFNVHHIFKCNDKHISFNDCFKIYIKKLEHYSHYAVTRCDENFDHYGKKDHGMYLRENQCNNIKHYLTLIKKMSV